MVSVSVTEKMNVLANELGMMKASSSRNIVRFFNAYHYKNEQGVNEDEEGPLEEIWVSHGCEGREDLDGGYYCASLYPDAASSVYISLS